MSMSQFSSPGKNTLQTDDRFVRIRIRDKKVNPLFQRLEMSNLFSYHRKQFKFV